jgi:aspartate carbamoyltransferase catalytic subunit
MERLSHLVRSQQLSPDILFHLFEEANSLRASPWNALNGKILASLFYEPSTRTRLSFESAMLKLGGSVVGTENAREFSSAVKGESLEDSIRIVGGYVDCIVLRHNETGAAELAAEVSSVPIINAGDGKGQHPTQALLDVYTIKEELGRLKNLKVAMVGDLASGRTVRSLAYLLGRFEGNELYFVSPSHLRIGEDIKEYLSEHKTPFFESPDLNNVLKSCDVIYMTRIQKERMNRDDYELAKGKFVINQETLQSVNPNSRIMHPLPHCEEISLPIDVEENDPRVAYFRQAKNGLYVRMALLKHMLEKEQ